MHRKNKKTVQERYGVDNVRKVKEIIDKGKQTCLEKYGHESHTQSAAFKEKRKEWSLERYGTTCPLNSEEIRDKIEETHGYRFIATTESHQKCMKEGVIKKFGVDNVSKVPEIRTKAIATTRSIFGVDNYKQLHYTNFDKWNDIEFIKNNFINNRNADFIKACNFFNSSYQTTLEHFRDELGIDMSNKGISSDENRIIKFIQNIVPDLDIQQGNRSIIKFEEETEKGIRKTYREIDIYIPEKRIAIEFDGLYFHSVGNDLKNVDEIRRRTQNLQLKASFLHDEGIRFLNIWENE